MEKIKFNKLGIELDVKQLDFSLIVGSGAEYCPDVTDFYQTALVSKTDASLFNNVPGNKASKRIPVLSTGRVIQPFTCGWNGKDVNLDAKEVAVDKMSVMHQICISDIEDSFEVWNMTSGANNPVNPQTLLSYIWNYLAEKTRNDMEYLRWYGDKSAVDPNNYLTNTNGFITLFENNVGLLNIVTSPVAITPTNVVNEFYRTLGMVDPIHRKNYKELSIFVSSNVFLAFLVAATTGNNTATHLVSDAGDLFLGKYRITEVPSLADNIMIMGPKQDFIYTYDLEEENFMTVDRTQYAAEPVVRFRLNLYFAHDIYDYSNIVYYGPSLS